MALTKQERAAKTKLNEEFYRVMALVTQAGGDYRGCERLHNGEQYVHFCKDGQVFRVPGDPSVQSPADVKRLAVVSDVFRYPARRGKDVEEESE